MGLGPGTAAGAKAAGCAAAAGGGGDGDPHLHLQLERICPGADAVALLRPLHPADQDLFPVRRPLHRGVGPRHGGDPACHRTGGRGLRLAATLPGARPGARGLALKGGGKSLRRINELRPRPAPA